MLWKLSVAKLYLDNSGDLDILAMIGSVLNYPYLHCCRAYVPYGDFFIRHYMYKLLIDMRESSINTFLKGNN